MKTQNNIKVIITDDSKIFRKEYREMLQPFPVEIIAEAENGKELLAILETKTPDVVLLDLEMPVMDGNEAFNIIRKDLPDIRIIIVTMYSSRLLIENYQERGAEGYIPKNILEPDLLYKAILDVSKGKTFFINNTSDLIAFNPRQKEMMPLILDNEPNKVIADDLGISKRAVEKQRQNMYQKMGATTTVDFFRIVFSKGFQYMSRVIPGTEK